MCLGEELEIGCYRGSELRLDAFVAEAIALAIPMQMLPPVDARGRCVECGEDRSQPVDLIESSRADSPFAVLANLRVGRDGGES